VTAWLACHRRSVLFLFAVAAVAGLFAAARLPVSLFPRIDFPRIVVSVDAGERPSDQMVVEVTRPLEQALRGVPDVRQIRSTTSRGAAELSVAFSWGADMVAAQLQVESAMNRALAEMPVGTTFEVRRMDPTVFPVVGLSMTSDKRSLVELRDLAYYRLRPLIATVPDVAQVEVLGGQLAEYQVQVDPARLAGAGISIIDLIQQLQASHLVSSAGRLEDRSTLFLTLTDARLRSREDILALPVRASGAGTVPLRAVADVIEAPAPLHTRVTADGRDAVLINVRQSRGANAPALVRAIESILAAHRDDLPPDVKVATFYDQSELVTAAARSVRDSILIGALLAAAVLFMFLRDLRLTLVVAIALPAVLAITSLLLQLFGMSFNIMTLGGMAAAVGLIVDDAVVMVEHMVGRHDEQRAPGEHGLLAAAGEMLRPLLGSSLATIVIFVPLAFLSGVTGGFFKALALTMASALAVSFLVAWFVVPLLADALLSRSAAGAHTPGWFTRLVARYAAAATAAIAHPARVAMLLVAISACGAVAYAVLPSGFMPKMDEGGFILDYRAMPGTSLAETDRLLRQVEERIRATPEVATYSRRTGVQLGGGLTEANEGDYFIRLRGSRSRDIEDVMADLRGRVEGEVPGLQIETAQLMEDLIGDLTAVPQPVEVKLFGGDLEQLRALAPRIAARIGQLPGVVEVQDGLRVAGDAVEVRVDRALAMREGLDADLVARQLEALVGGTVVGRIQAGEKLVGIRVWSSPSARRRVESIGELRLRGADGRLLPVRRIATVSVVSGQPQVQREDLAQQVAVTARLEGRDLGSAMADVRRAIGAMVLPHGVRVEYGGLYAEQQKSFAALGLVFAAAVLLVIALLLFVYEQWAVVIAILATVLVAASTVFAGLLLTRTELNISAMMGLTMTVGIVAELAVFYFAELDVARASSPAMLVAAGQRRLRPILMTTLIAILALLPLALGIGSGAEMQAPLAIAIIAGLVGALPLVLLAMPALYGWLRRSPPPSRS
jgi:CzcA family heavy metal efflux pump